MSKLLIVRKSVERIEWMKHMPDPLIPNQKVVVHSEQVHVDGTPIDNTKYVRIKHGKGSVSVFNISMFKNFGQR